MADDISNDSKQKYIYAKFNKINADTLIVIKNQNNEIITAFKTKRSIENILYSSDYLDYESYKIYIGGTIDGEEVNGLYTIINNYNGGEEITYNDLSKTLILKDNNISSLLLRILLIEIGLFIVIASYLYIVIKKWVKIVLK